MVSHGRRRIAVLGGAGFIGSEVVRQLLRADSASEIVVVDNASAGTLSNLPSDRRVLVRHESVEGLNLEDIGFPDVVIYLVAQPFVPLSHGPAGRAQTMWANVGLLTHFLDVNQNTPFTLVYGSSAEVYGDVSCPASEDMGPNLLRATLANPYAESRAKAELVLWEWAWTHRRDVRVIRIFNALGPRATHAYFVPAMLAQLAWGTHLRHGSLDTVRDWVWVCDTAKALVLAADLQPKTGVRVFNAASGIGTAMKDVLDELSRLVGHSALHLVDPDRLRPTELRSLVGDPEKAYEQLGWRAEVSWRDALKRTVEWYVTSGATWPYDRRDPVATDVTVTRSSLASLEKLRADLAVPSSRPQLVTFFSGEQLRRAFDTYGHDLLLADDRQLAALTAEALKHAGKTVPTSKVIEVAFAMIRAAGRESGTSDVRAAGDTTGLNSPIVRDAMRIDSIRLLPFLSPEVTLFPRIAREMALSLECPKDVTIGKILGTAWWLQMGLILANHGDRWEDLLRIATEVNWRLGTLPPGLPYPIDRNPELLNIPAQLRGLYGWFIDEPESFHVVVVPSQDVYLATQAARTRPTAYLLVRCRGLHYNGLAPSVVDGTRMLKMAVSSCPDEAQVFDRRVRGRSLMKDFLAASSTDNRYGSADLESESENPRYPFSGKRSVIVRHRHASPLDPQLHLLPADPRLYEAVKANSTRINHGLLFIGSAELAAALSTLRRSVADERAVDRARHQAHRDQLE